MLRNIHHDKECAPLRQLLLDFTTRLSSRTCQIIFRDPAWTDWSPSEDRIARKDSTRVLASYTTPRIVLNTHSCRDEGRLIAGP